MSIFKASASIFPIFLFCTWACLFKIHDAYDNVYIDEEFHVPQTQRFCRGNTEVCDLCNLKLNEDELIAALFQWDPKITTPPGLYIVSYAALKILGFSSNTFLCDIFLLRLVNSIFICLNFIILCWVYSKIHKNVMLMIYLYHPFLFDFNCKYFYSVDGLNSLKFWEFLCSQFCIYSVFSTIQM